MALREIYLAKNLKNFRFNNNLTQKALAEKIGCHEWVITRYEVKFLPPSLQNIFRLAELLNVSLDDLVFKDLSKEQSEKELSAAQEKELDQKLKEQELKIMMKIMREQAEREYNSKY